MAEKQAVPEVFLIVYLTHQWHTKLLIIILVTIYHKIWTIESKIFIFTFTWSTKPMDIGIACLKKVCKHAPLNYF